jgi:hypothetical protein
LCIDAAPGASGKGVKGVVERETKKKALPNYENASSVDLGLTEICEVASLTSLAFFVDFGDYVKQRKGRMGVHKSFVWYGDEICRG